MYASYTHRQTYRDGERESKRDRKRLRKSIQMGEVTERMSTNLNSKRETYKDYLHPVTAGFEWRYIEGQ